MKKRNVLLLALMFAFGAICANAATTPAVETTDGVAFTWRNIIGANQSATIGWSFMVGPQDLEIDALGIYDHGQNGLADAHPVGIWTIGGSLLKQTTVPSGTAGTLVGSYRYASISPLTLTAGHSYMIGMYMPTVIDRCGSDCGDESLVFGAETFASGITFLLSNQTRAIIGNGSLAFPGLDAEIPQGFFGPNFLLATADADPVASPEPTSLALAGLGIGALLAIRRRTCPIR
jgi:MYXO-CTERM domain-containing protein